jgi:iron-sulfur cluster assembly accessory protein
MATHIDISEPAKAELKRLAITRENFLRILVIPGGCSGLIYQLGTDSVQTTLDEVLYDDQDLRVITDRESLSYLRALSLDYSSDLIEGGFRFHNPNAAAACGCGSSFSANP